MDNTGTAAPVRGKTRPPAASLAIDLLGGFRVRVNGHPLPDSVWRLSKARGLLKLLALAHGHRLQRDQVLDVLWPGLEPEAAANNLHQTLHAVRRALRCPEAAAEIRLQHGLLVLQPDGPLEVDVDAFERAAAAALGSDEPALYHAALALYAGDLLPEDIYEDWAAERREALRETFLQLLLDVARRHEARGELKAAMETLRRAVETDPTREEGHLHLMRLYASTGQRARALRQYARLEEALASELDAEPDEHSRRLYRSILAGEPDQGEEPLTTQEPKAPQHNLQLPLTSFIGREREIDQVKQLLSSARLVSLTGVGGAGKTRLATRTGWDMVDAYRDGVWLVQLASLAQGDLLPAVVAAALGLAEQPEQSWTESLVEHLRTRHLLLILDNCEHLRESCAALCIQLLAECAELQILATSRMRVGVPGESTVMLEPLSTPDVDLTGVDEIAESEAVRLFVERARFRHPRFSLTPQTAAGIARICRQVDGIPLAIELAAGRMGALSVDQIAEHLSDAPGLLVSTDAVDARHATLGAALDWSYALLNEGERHTFRYLSVFEGGWDLEGAQAVGDGDPLHTLDAVSRLVDASLVVAEGKPDGSVRYRFLEPVRQYARDRLCDAGELDQAHRRHAERFAALALEALEALEGADARLWVERLDAEISNLRAAIRWSLEAREPEMGLRIAGNTWRFWVVRGYLREGREVLAALLEAAELDGSVPPDVQALAFKGAGALAYFQADMDDAKTKYEPALALFRALGDETQMGKVLNNLALVLKDQGEYAGAEASFEEALELASRRGDKRGAASTLGNLGILAQEHGDYDRARALHERSLRIRRELEDPFHVITTLNNLGSIAVEQGQYARARVLIDEVLSLTEQHGPKRSTLAAMTNLGHMARKQCAFSEAIARYKQALLLAQELGNKVGSASVLEGVAATLVGVGDHVRAVVLFAAADGLREAAGTPLVAIEQAEYAVILDELKAALGDEFEGHWGDGRIASLESIVERVLNLPVHGTARL